MRWVWLVLLAIMGLSLVLALLFQALIHIVFRDDDDCGMDFTHTTGDEGDRD